MENVKILAAIFWIPQALYQFVHLLYWIQVKEYRFDRFYSFIRTEEGRRETYFYFYLIKYLLVLLSLIFFTPLLILVIIFILADIYILILFIKRKIRKPIFTERIQKILLIGGILLTLTLFSYVITDFINISLFIGETSIFIGLSSGLYWTKIIVEQIRKREIDKAALKLRRIKPFIICLTGSYGKTTTKEFIAKLLSEKYKVDCTFKNENTDFGIARKIIDNLKLDTQVFVVEIGAYKKGEIAKLTNIIKPSIGIITGIEPQHIDLFGSMSNLKQAKYELISSLPESGTAIVNLSSFEARELYERAKKEKRVKKVLGYYLKNNFRIEKILFEPAIESHILAANEDGVHFEVREGGSAKKIFAPLHGLHFIENVTCAILVARLMKVDWKQIEKLCSELEMPDKTMKLTKLSYGALVIDDTYNTTPKSFEAALKYLKFFKGKKKVVITRGVSELGKISRAVHKTLGMSVEKYADMLISTNSEIANYLRSGMSVNSAKVVTISDPDKLVAVTEKLIEEGAVILLEGRINQKLVDFLERRKNG